MKKILETLKQKWAEYLLEILVIMIGILGAFMLDNWNDNRLQSELEKQYLKSLITDLNRDITEIETVNSGNSILISGFDELLELLANPKEDKEYQRTLYIRNLKDTYWYLIAEFSDLTLAQLKNSGNLQIIKDSEVTKAILLYEQGLLACKKQFDDLVVYFHAYEKTQKEIFDLTLGKEAFDFMEKDNLNMLQPVDKFQDLVPEGDYIINNDPKILAIYYGDILYFKTTLNNTILILTKQKEMANELIRLIESNYKIQNNF